MEHEIIYKAQTTTGIPIEVPQPLQHYLLPWPQETICCHFPFGHIIMQRYRGSRIGACYYVTALKEEVTILFSSKRAMATLHCQLKNNITTRLAGAGQSTILPERSYAAYSIPAIKESESTFHAGITESFHFEFDEQYVRAAAEHYDEFAKLPYSMQPGIDEVYALPSCPLSFEASDILHDELFPLKPCEMLEQNIRIQAAKLMAHYRTDSRPFTLANMIPEVRRNPIYGINTDQRRKRRATPPENSSTEYDLSY